MSIRAYLNTAPLRLPFQADAPKDPPDPGPADAPDCLDVGRLGGRKRIEALGLPRDADDAGPDAVDVAGDMYGALGLGILDPPYLGGKLPARRPVGVDPWPRNLFVGCRRSRMQAKLR